MKFNILTVVSLLLSFSNDIGDILSFSNNKILKSIYKPCINKSLGHKLNLHKNICKLHHNIFRLFIDTLTLIGILLVILRNTLDKGFLDGLFSGISIITLSYILPTLFLHDIVHFFINKFNIKSIPVKMLITFSIIFILLIITVCVEYFIDFILEKEIFKKINDDITKKIL